MTTQSIKVFVPPAVSMPRGAVWTSRFVTAVSRRGRQVWQALEAIGRARARRELRELVARNAHRPEFAAMLRDAMHHAAMHRDSQH